ncbi:Uncharacterised protein [Plesiomonas shigelloides]|nr:Uncharacterised protein [Plesiomonas shigelloides]
MCPAFGRPRTECYAYFDLLHFLLYTLILCVLQSRQRNSHYRYHCTYHYT